MHRERLEQTFEQTGKGDVLIVEDTPASLELLCTLLAGDGYDVRHADNGERALRLARERTPELILLDIRMPGIDGFEVCRRLKADARLAHVPVVFLSAHHDLDDKVRGFALGGADFIDKPFQTEEILARVGVQVRLSRALSALEEERASLELRVVERTSELASMTASLELQVAARRADEEFLRLAGRAFAATHDAIIMADGEGRILGTNPALTRHTGFTEQELKGRHVASLRSSMHNPGFYELMIASLHASGEWSGEIQALRKNGDTYPALITASLVRDAAGAIEHYVIVCKDVTERKAEQHLIDFLSHHDALTGLPNRQLARSRFDEALAGARRNDGCVAVMCLDLDHFKSINDSYGPPRGDKALQAVAALLGTCVREGDTVSRQGGDEFQIIVQDDAQFSATLAAAQRILDGLRQKFDIDGEPLALTTSIGIAVSPGDGDTFDDLVRNADTALFRAKETGRDNYAFYAEHMDADVHARLAIQMQLRGAIARGEFEVYYQPQMSLCTGELVGAEALLRWDNPVLGKVPPNRFIPLAEEYGLINAIGAWVLDTVCAQIRVWQEQGLGNIKVAVNLAGAQFAHDSTVPMVEDTLRRHGVSPAFLGLEITEGTVMGDPDKAVAALRRLKDIGVGISLDDFGTGYSSLGYLKRFPIDVLKIDKSFVDDVACNDNDAAIALSVISLAHNLNMRVIAEGVETRAQADFLAAHGCDEMQGYYFSRPVAVDAFTALLRAPRNLLSM